MAGRKRRKVAAVEAVERRLLLSTVSGVVYSDVNQNGSQDAGETGLSGWTVYLDQNNNGVFDQNLSSGSASAGGLPRNIPDVSTIDSPLNVSGVADAITHLTLTFNITHTFDSDLQISLIGPTGTRELLVNRVGSSGHNFTNTTLDDSAPTLIDQGSAPFSGTFRPDSPLSGFNGQSPNGTWTLEVSDRAPGDTGTLNSWSLQLTTGEASAQTDASGNYSFIGLASGTYHVREIVKPEFTETSPPDGVYAVTLDGTNSVVGRDFGNHQPPGSISGSVFNDLNGNHTRDPGEPGLSGITVYIDSNNNGQLDPGEPGTLTDSAGNYSLPAPIPGSYHVREVLPAGWAQTRPGAELNVGQNVNVSREPGNQAEGAIAVNPNNPNQLFEMCNEDVSLDALSMATSNDGGLTWTRRVGATGSDHIPAACCDPSVSWDSYGNLFIAYVAATLDRVVVADSTDGGQSFSAVAQFAGNVDQPTLVTGHGEVWVTWNDGSMMATGAAVTGPGAVGSFSAVQAMPGPQGSFGDLAIGPAGQVMEAYQDNTDGVGPSNLYVSVDPDGLGPQGFSAPTPMRRTNVGGFDFIPPQSGRSIDAEVGLAWDRSGGPHNGRVYLVYTDSDRVGSANTDIFLCYSDDDGSTWSTPLRVNDDATANAQFLPRIAIDQTSGNVAMSWYDCRNDLGTGGPSDTDGIANTDAQFYATASIDGGLSVLPNVRVSAGTTNAADAKSDIDLGDYTGLAFQSGRFYPLWADNSDSTLDNPGGKLSGLDQYTATVTLTTPPEGGGFTVSAGPDNNAAGVDFGNHPTAAVPSVVGRSLFYNDSRWDGNDPAAGAQDDDAIAPDKQALLPGQTAAFDNVSSYSRGINGLLIDIAGSPGTIGAGDLAFSMGNSSDPASWAGAPAPLSVSQRPEPDGSTRVDVVWADNVIQNTWLQVTMKADADTGLASPDVFYFGSLIGASGASASPLTITSADEAAARADPHSFLNPAGITDTQDFNRDGRVDAADQIIARNNLGASLVALGPAVAAPATRRRAVVRFTMPAAAPALPALEQSTADALHPIHRRPVGT